MSLEDHVGDVVRKSRIGLGVSIQKLSQVAGINAKGLSDFEEDGEAKGIDLNAVSRLLCLDEKKLLEMANGWKPICQDLSKWRHLRQIQTDENGMAVNCFLVWDGISKEAALFDTGWDFDLIRSIIETFQLHLEYICITHSHSDHIAALNEVRAFSPNASLFSNAKGAPQRSDERDGMCFEIGELSVSCRETPGHAEDGLTFVISGFPEKMPSVAIVGDAIFAGSIGGAKDHFELAKERVSREIFSLPNSTLICPGHGPVTTVQEEKDHNPFFISDL